MNHNSVALIVTVMTLLPVQACRFVASMIAVILLCGRWSFLLVARYAYLATNRR